VFAAVSVVACAGDDDSETGATEPAESESSVGATTTASPSSSRDTAPASTIAEATSIASSAATTISEAHRGTVDTPRPVGVPGESEFSYQEPFGEAEWDGFVTGSVETAVDEFVDKPGRCILVLGTITPTAAKGATSDEFSTPPISLIAGGKVLEDTIGECDEKAVRAAGYGWILDARVTIGTAYPFFAEFFVPGKRPAELEAVVVGDPTGSDALFYEPTILDTIPPP
jgi:hypothetical protein